MAFPRIVGFIACLAALGPATEAEGQGPWLRANAAGYEPLRAKRVWILAESARAGEEWTLADERGHVCLSGTLGPSEMGAGPHTPMAGNHEVDWSELTREGNYTLRLGETPLGTLRIAADPLAPWRDRPLRHLRALRSGSRETGIRGVSHLGDSKAAIWRPQGPVEEGRWAPAAGVADGLGGWYDAGDQIKFTLNHAYAVVHLLLAYRIREGDTQREALWEEAVHGLDWLSRVRVDENTLIIQVGDARDHQEPERLPEEDALDGKRPALCALSRVHLASVAAALALGADVARERGDRQSAERWLSLAEWNFASIDRADTVKTAFERDAVNDFYHDPSEEDQRALAAALLHRVTGKAKYRQEAKRWRPEPAYEVSWASWHWLALAAMGPTDEVAKERLQLQRRQFEQFAQEAGAPWGLPGPYTWGSLHRWIGAANAVQMAWRAEGRPGAAPLFLDIVDYVFGRNNWGVSFLLAQDLPNTLKNLYSPMYRLLGVFPEGALSEGPGEARLHASLASYFSTDQREPWRRFNTEAGVFFDDGRDFMCQEATLTGQTDVLLLLALAWEAEKKDPVRRPGL